MKTKSKFVILTFLIANLVAIGCSDDEEEPCVGARCIQTPPAEDASMDDASMDDASMDDASMDADIEADASADMGAPVDMASTPDLGEPAEVPEGSYLEHVSPCDPAADVCVLDATFGDSFDIEVLLLGPADGAIANAEISFELDPRAAVGTILATRYARTSANGVATNSFSAGQTTGVAQVVTTVSNAEVEPLTFRVAVNPAGSASYRIYPEYAGSRALEEVETFLYAANNDCAAIIQDRDSGAPQLTAEAFASADVGAELAIPPLVFPGVQDGTTYNVYVEASTRAGNVLARGCADQNPAIANGNGVDITVSLADN